MQIIKIVLCVAMLLAQLLYYIRPKRARALFGALWIIISLILLWALILL